MTASSDLPYFHVDAFARRPFEGNQAAVMPLDEWPEDPLLQKIAEENNFAETAYIVADGRDADFALRWFTPALEIALCGHATLASGHVVLSMRPEMNSVRFATRKAGILTVSRDGEGGYEMALPAYPAQPHDWPEALAALGGDAEQVVRNDAGYTIVRYGSADAVRALDPDLRALAAFGSEMFIATAPGKGDSSGADVVSRVFVPGAGVDEDSVTGSAHAALTPYWAGELGRDAFTAYQASARGGHVACRAEGDRAILGGFCVTVVEGIFKLPAELS